MKKAMLLAAGRGERLKPLTDSLPKPLMQVGSMSLIEHNLLKLKASGIEEVVINVCYRAKQIMEQIGDGQRYGLKVIFSYEPNKPLGTGGGVSQALRFLGDAPFILLSSDIWTDYPFDQLRLLADQVAHLVMVENPYFHPKGDYSLLPTGLLDPEVEPKYTYGNIAIIHPDLFKESVDHSFPIANLFVKGMQAKKISGELYRGKWFNVGTIEELKRLNQMFHDKKIKFSN